MEKVVCIYISHTEQSIIVRGHRGTQRRLMFGDPVSFLQAIQYCQYKMLPQDIFYID